LTLTGTPVAPASAVAVTRPGTVASGAAPPLDGGPPLEGGAPGGGGGGGGGSGRNAATDAERLLVWLVETCRERGAIVALAFPLAVAASLRLRRGSLADAARRLSNEAGGLGEDAIGSFLHSVTLTTAAFVAANLGDAETCVRRAEQARAIALRLDLTSTPWRCSSSAGTTASRSIRRSRTRRRSAKVGFRPVGVMRAYERDTGGQGRHDGLLMDLPAGEQR
jgi:hypothetical protein